MIKDFVKIEFGLEYYGLYKQNYAITCTDTDTVSSREGGGEGRTCVDNNQKWTLLQQVFTLNTANNLWKTQSLLCNENQGFCPQPAQYAGTAFGSGYSVHSRMGLSPVYFSQRPQFQSFAKQSFVILNGLSLTDRCCQQSNNDAAPQSVVHVLLLYIRDNNNRCSIAIGHM